jgi:fucose permease
VTAAARGRGQEPSLPRAYWLAWTFLVLCIGAESSFVAWGAQVAVAQVGIALADATALGSLFVLGLIVGRVLLGAGGGPRIEPKRLLAGMVLVGITGGLLVWWGPEVALVGAGLLAGGLGLAGVWATAAGVAVANAPRSPVLAGARLNPASGVAMLVVPLLLGVVATAVGVLAAWGIVLGLLVAALVVLRVVPAGPSAFGRREPVSEPLADVRQRAG